MSASQFTTSVQRRAMTLLELLVVLAILAAMTMVALQSMNGVIDQSRWEATQKTLSEIQTALVGAANSTGTQSQSVTCFLADMGRLPKTPDGVISPLNELILNVNGMPIFEIVTIDSDVQVPRGWRGPYVRLPVGSTSLCDGWGREFIWQVDSNGCLIALASLGADGLIDTVGGTAGNNRDLSIELLPPVPHAEQVSGTLYSSVDTGTLVPPATIGTYKVQVYEPHPSGANLSAAVGSPEYHGVLRSEFDVHSSAFTFAATPSVSKPLTIGPRVLRVFLNGAPAAGSAPHYLTFRSGDMLTSINLRTP